MMDFRVQEVANVIDDGLNRIWHNLDSYCSTNDLSSAEILAVLKQIGYSDITEMYENWIFEGWDPEYQE